MLRDKIVAELNYIISGGKITYLDTVARINEYFISLVTPKNLDGNKNNIIIQYQVNFEKLCIALMNNGTQDPKKMTVFRFYAALQFFEEQKPKQPQR